MWGEGGEGGGVGRPKVLIRAGNTLIRDPTIVFYVLKKLNLSSFVGILVRVLFKKKHVIVIALFERSTSFFAALQSLVIQLISAKKFIPDVIVGFSKEESSIHLIFSVSIVRF